MANEIKYYRLFDIWPGILHYEPLLEEVDHYGLDRKKFEEWVRGKNVKVDPDGELYVYKRGPILEINSEEWVKDKPALAHELTHVIQYLVGESKVRRDKSTEFKNLYESDPDEWDARIQEIVGFILQGLSKDEVRKVDPMDTLPDKVFNRMWDEALIKSGKGIYSGRSVFI